MTTIGERLREERERLGMTQEQLGAVGRVKKLAQMNYESSKRVPDALYLARLQQGAGVNVMYVLTGELHLPAAVMSEVILRSAASHGDSSLAESGVRNIQNSAQAYKDALNYPLVRSLLNMLAWCDDNTIHDLTKAAWRARLPDPVPFAERVPRASEQESVAVHTASLGAGKAKRIKEVIGDRKAVLILGPTQPEPTKATTPKPRPAANKTTSRKKAGNPQRT